MNPDLIKIILSFGALQGIIMSANLVFSKDDKRQAKYFMAGMIWMIVVELLRSAWNAPQWAFDCIPHFYTLALIFTFPPNLYLYTKALTQTERINTNQILRIHTVSFAAFGVVSGLLCVHFFVVSLPLDWFSSLIKALSLAVFWWYYRISFAEFYAFKQFDVQSDLLAVERETIITWLNRFLNVVFVVALVWTVNILFQYTGLTRLSEILFMGLELLFIVSIYWVGYAGFQRIKVVYLNEQRNTQVFFNSIESNEIERCLEKLTQVMEIEKQYLDPELNLQKLANSIHIPYKVVSAVLNQRLNVGFNEYVNQYRVEEFKQRILDPQNARFNIASIAYDSGFNSLATFQRAFKTMTGITPKEYIKSTAFASMGG